MSDLSVSKKLVPYKPKNKVRFVTASLRCVCPSLTA